MDLFRVAAARTEIFDAPLVDLLGLLKVDGTPLFALRLELDPVAVIADGKAATTDLCAGMRMASSPHTIIQA